MSNQFATFSNREHPTAANVTTCLYLADKHLSALLIELNKSLFNLLWCSDVCTTTAGPQRCTWPPPQGQSKVEVRNKRPFHWSVNDTGEERGGNWKMPFKCLVMHVRPQTDVCTDADVSAWSGDKELKSLCTRVWVYVLYIMSEYFCRLSVSCQLKITIQLIKIDLYRVKLTELLGSKIHCNIGLCCYFKTTYMYKCIDHYRQNQNFNMWGNRNLLTWMFLCVCIGIQKDIKIEIVSFFFKCLCTEPKC